MSYLLHAHQLRNNLQFDEAIACYDKAIEIDPECASAYFDRGMTRFSLLQFDRVEADLQRGLSLDPKNHVMLYQAHMFYTRGFAFFETIKLLRAAITLKPDYEEAWVAMAENYENIGDTDGARKLYDHLATKFPGNVIVKMRRACLLPHIPFSQEEIDRLRIEFMDNLDRLMKEDFTLANPAQQIRVFPFYHAYHARNNVDMARKLAEVFYRKCPNLHYTAKHCLEPKKAKKKLRVGFVSQYMHQNLNQFWQYFIEGLAKRSDFEVLVFSTSATHIPKIQEISAQVHKYVQLSERNVEEPREAIAREELDIIVNLEIGMAGLTYFLAMARLAPVQCVLAGHPVTTGIPTMDYFIASRLLEPENAESHYSEKLVLTDRNLSVFQRPVTPKNIKTREELGLPGSDMHIYCCPVMLFKLHPDMDRIFAAILERDPKAIILLFNAPYKQLWASSLKKRFAASMPAEHVNRIVFIPHADKDRFFQILTHCDAILDSVHFSFGTTSFLALGANLPFVTWPGEFLRGRTAYAQYIQMGITDLIAKTHEDYVELALRLAGDKAFYADMSEKIKRHSDVLFNDVMTIDEFADRLHALYAMAL